MDPETVGNILHPQDVSTHQIWDSYIWMSNNMGDMRTRLF